MKMLIERGGAEMYLQLENIHKSYVKGENRSEVLRGFSCKIEEGCICALLGPYG